MPLHGQLQGRIGFVFFAADALGCWRSSTFPRVEDAGGISPTRLRNSEFSWPSIRPLSLTNSAVYLHLAAIEPSNCASGRQAKWLAPRPGISE